MGDMVQKLCILKRNEYVSSFWIRNKGKSVLFPEDGFPSLKICLQVRRSAVIDCGRVADQFALAAIASSVFVTGTAFRAWKAR
jgi:hypothetical protein